MIRESLAAPAGYELAPKSIRQIDRAVFDGKTVCFSALSCPDYLTTNGDNYMGSDVPRLTQLHIDAIQAVADAIPTESLVVEVLLADTDSLNPFFVDKYADGDTEKYLQICRTTEQAIMNFLTKKFPVVSTSVNSFLGLNDSEDKFADYRDRYLNFLKELYVHDPKFCTKIRNYVAIKRNDGYYTRQFGGVLSFDEIVEQKILGIAEYLTLGCLLSRRATATERRLNVVVMHTTSNTPYFSSPPAFSPESFGLNPNAPKLPLLIRREPII